MTPVLVVGVPRSGTTWVAEVLAGASGAAYLHEPDNHLRFAYAFRAKLQLGQRAYPMLRPDDRSPATAAYAALWERALSRGPRTRGAGFRRRFANRLVTRCGPVVLSHVLANQIEPRAVAAATFLAVPEQPPTAERLVVKSVYAPLSVEWIAARHDVEVVVVLRNPLNVLSSWLALDWLPPSGPDALSTLDPAIATRLAEQFAAPPQPTSVLARAAWLIGLLSCAIEDVARRHKWTTVVHDELSAMPHEGFREIASSVGVRWSSDGDRLIKDAARPGQGYATSRSAAQLRDSWKQRLNEHQVRQIREVLDQLPLDVYAR